jgi:DNA-binding NarL/FixJ family response regulator
MPEPKPEPDTQLTAREHQVLILLCEGLRMREIGLRLGISSKTVEHYRAEIGKKWDVDSIAMLVRKAIRRGVIHP